GERPTESRANHVPKEKSREEHLSRHRVTARVSLRTHSRRARLLSDSVRSRKHARRISELRIVEHAVGAGDGSLELDGAHSIGSAQQPRVRGAAKQHA